MKNPTDPARSSPVQDYLDDLHRTLSVINDGKVATYIPELAKANPSWFGIALVTTGGSVYETGDSRQEFTIQSISKPFVYGLALEDHGRSSVLERVGVEPTGDAFNSISLDPGTGRPRNPMINAGAIATAGLIQGKTQAIRLKRLLETFSSYAGRNLGLDETVYRSESETGHRNRAIGHMLRNFDKIDGDPMPVVDLYFKQCSISVTCRDLAMMAATLANRGINPVTGKQAIQGGYVESVLSVMGSCGMYDYAGEWMYSVGMPAKSGVAGGIVAVLPGRLGIGIFSPPLDSRGNSVRGIAVCNEISRHLDLHLLNRQPLGNSVIRLKSTGAELNSSRVRTAPENQILRERGCRIAIYQLQEHLTFASTEVLLRDVMERLNELDCLVLDFKRALSINESACRFLHRLLLKLKPRGKSLVIVHAQTIPLLRKYMKKKLERDFDSHYLSFEDIDRALEWCENRLLAATISGWEADHAVGHAEYELFNGLSPDEIEVIVACLARETYSAGEHIIRTGDEASELFFLAKGTVSVILPTESGGSKRLATFSAGMAFGEMAVLDRAPRSAMIVADTDVACDLLKLSDFEQLSVSHPTIKIKLLQNLSLNLCHKLRKANRELSVLE